MRADKLFRVLLIGACLAPGFTHAAVTVNEALFDPTGSDTGLEAIELYNPDASPVVMGEWELYPDGIGYFVFPASFSLEPHAFVTVHLRVSGTDDEANLYHASASSNMGNSSGSVALFRSGGRSKDTIVDFVRYQKIGSSERKTWESTAVEAGLWAAGDVVSITDLPEGNSIALTLDGARGSSSSWKVVTSPTIGSSNTASGSDPDSGSPTGVPPESPPAAATSTAPVVVDNGHAPVPSLGADAGFDAAALAGAVVEFRGTAFGLDGKPLSGARYLWNFGDGSIKEGKSLTHIYHFPGTYHANLAVSSGEIMGSDWRVITVFSPDLRVSEVRPGPDGFIELWNNAAEVITLDGMRLSDGGGGMFSVPPQTRVGARGAIIFPNAITWLNPSGRVALADARGNELDVMTLGGSPGSGGSWELSGDTVRLQQHPTPGTVELGGLGTVIAEAERSDPVLPKSDIKHIPLLTRATPSAEDKAESVPSSLAPSFVQAEMPPRQEQTSMLFAGTSRGWVYFSASFLSSILIAFFAIGMKRWLG